MVMFDMTPKRACQAFGVALAWLKETVTYGGDVGHTRYGGVVKKITSADLAALLARERAVAPGAGRVAGGEGE